jgi:hypothetical protein
MTNKEAVDHLRYVAIFANKMADHIEGYIGGAREKIDDEYMIYLSGQLVDSHGKIIDYLKEIAIDNG